MKHRVLVISHGHPDFQIGGGEKAAYLMYKGYRELKDNVEDAYFLSPSFKAFNGRIERYKDNEFFWHVNVTDQFFMKSNQRETINTFFIPFLKTVKLNLIHVNHYIHLGLDFICSIKKHLPQSKIILTLHEYIPICFHSGQMIKRYDYSLCYKSSIDECNTCFPEIRKEWFFLRKHRFMSIFEYVDVFVSPSYFLRERFIDWGIPKEKIYVIENGFPKFEKLPPRKLKDGEGRNRFAFFGQINPYKGLDVVLEGLLSLPPTERKKVKLFINGPYLENVAPEVREKIKGPLEKLKKEGVVFHLGPYKGYEEMRDRLKNVDWVILPSIWWENSPMVIQEAFGMGRPVVCSNIGGMAEKVKDGINGIHVPVRNPYAWAETMLELASPENAELWDKLYQNLHNPPHYKDVADNYIKLIEGI